MENAGIPLVLIARKWNMNSYHRPLCFTILTAGLISSIGCGLTPKASRKTPQDSRAGSPESAPLKKVSPELAAEACLATARLLEEKGRHQDAISQYERARLHQPDRSGIAHRLAMLHDRMGNTQAAWKEYQIRAQGNTPQCGSAQ
jgi:hypothetical protein